MFRMYYVQQKFSHLPSADRRRFDARDVVFASSSIEGGEERDGYDLRSRYANRAIFPRVSNGGVYISVMTSKGHENDESLFDESQHAPRGLLENLSYQQLQFRGIAIVTQRPQCCIRPRRYVVLIGVIYHTN